MEEIIDILDEKTGKPTWKKIEKSKAHAEGIWHSAIHILIVNEDKTHTLLQKRCEDKKLYPNTWDIAVGGHVAFGESPLASAKRELTEEIGVDSTGLNIEYIKTIKESLNNNGIISNEFVSIFILYKNIDLKDIVLQKEEVSEINWFDYESLNKLINTNQIIPHVEEYRILKETLKN